MEDTLEEVRAAKDQAYQERNMCVAALSRVAQSLGCRVWLGQHDPADAAWEDDWRNIVFIDLPTGQVSWHIHDSELHLFGHLPRGATGWDGHTNAEKYVRLLRWRP